MRDNLLFKTIVVLLAGLSFGIIANLGHPVTSEYVRQLGFQDKMFGYLFSGMSLGMIVSSPMWGRLGDKYKTRYLVGIAYVFYGVGQFMFSIFTTQYLLIFARFISGFAVAGGSINIYSYIYRCEFKIDNKLVLSYYIPLMALGGSIGYLIGGNLGTVFNEHLEGVLRIQSVAAILFGIVMFLLLSDNENIHLDSNKTRDKTSRIPTQILILFTATFLFAFGFTNINKFLDVFINAWSNGDTSAVGNFVFITGIVKLIVSVIFVPLAVKSSKNRIVGSITQIIGGLLIIFTFSDMTANVVEFRLYSTYMAAMALLAFSMPITIQLIRENSNEDLAYNLGLRQMFHSIGLFTSTLVGGYLYGYSHQLFFIINAAVVIIAGIVLAISYKDRSRGTLNG